jgi:hypothetical protein
VRPENGPKKEKSMSEQSPLMTQKEAAAYLKCCWQSLRNYRLAGQGPPYSRVGKSPRYRKTDLDAWLEKSRVDPSAMGAH